MYVFSDVDECSVNNGGCAQNCTNKLPGFECSCNVGYRLDSDKLGCSGELDKCGGWVGGWVGGECSGFDNYHGKENSTLLHL